MENIAKDIEELKPIYDYVTESIIITNKEHDIKLMNKAALKKFKVDEDEANLHNLKEFIPLQEQDKIFKTIQNDDDRYFDVFMKKANNEMFPVFLSGQELKIDNELYGILTIVDITDLKKDEKDKIKKLKSHIITQATTHAQKENKIKGKETEILLEMQEKLDQIKHENLMLERKLVLFERENLILNQQSEKLQESSFSFEQILDREMALAKRYDRKFSLAIVQIENFKELSEQLKTEAKRDLVVKAFKKHFKSTIRTTDVVYYENSGRYYFILPNAPDINITDLVERLLHAKKIDTKIVVRFNCGLAHYYENDTREHLLYRARKNLQVNIDEKNTINSSR